MMARGAEAKGGDLQGSWLGCFPTAKASKSDLPAAAAALAES